MYFYFNVLHKVRAKCQLKFFLQYPKDLKTFNSKFKSSLQLVKHVPFSTYSWSKSCQVVFSGINTLNVNLGVYPANTFTEMWCYHLVNCESPFTLSTIVKDKAISTSFIQLPLQTFFILWDTGFKKRIPAGCRTL